MGHQISFDYCRKENNGLPCPKTLDCWYNYFSVEDFLKNELTPKQWEEAFANPVNPKINTLLDLIEKAKKNKEQKGS